jgi:F-type H+-transporting ATPase subunit b
MRLRLVHIAALAALLCAIGSSASALAGPAEHGHPTQGTGMAVPADAHAHDDHAPSFHEINWVYGIISTREGAPSLFFRPPGMPVPILGLVINTAVLFGLLYYFGRRPLSEALKRRKARILQGMDDAARMKSDAETRLAEYEDKLSHIDQEIERVRSEMRQAAEAERVRVLREAGERRERMERDARLLVEHELKAARELLQREAVQLAVRAAHTVLAAKVTAADHERLARDHAEQLRQAAGALRGKL